MINYKVLKQIIKIEETINLEDIDIVLDTKTI